MNPYRRGLPAVLPRAAAVAAAVAVITVLAGLSPSTIVLVDLAIVAVALADLALAPSPQRLSVAREVAAVAGLGAATPLSWRVRNDGSRSAAVAVADDLAPSLRAARRRFVARVPAGATVRAATTLRPSRRGRFEPREVTVRVAGPLGLMARQGRHDVPGRLRVYPPFRSREEAELRIDRARILEVGLRSARGRGTGTEFESLRDWTEGDELRRIDWSATARAGKPIVREFRAERNQTVIVMLDAGRLMAARVADVPRLEHAMDAVMMLTAVATRLGDRAGLVAFDREVRRVVTPARSHGQLGRVTEAMYDLEPQLVESDYRAAFTAAVTRFRRRALIVLLTELTEQAFVDAVLPALPIVLRTHLVLIGGIVDPEVAGWAAASPADSAGAYRKAAAARALQERRRIVNRLQTAGATVVDAPPGSAAPALADAYLRFKATGRL